MKITGVILAGGKGLQLYPLTPRYSKALLPVGNKRLIMYQLEMLEKANVSNIVVLINEETRRVEEEVAKVFAGKTPLAFHFSPEDNHTYAALAHLLNGCPAGLLEENLLLVSSDIITSISLREPLLRFAERKLDFLMVCRAAEQKKLVKQKDKKEEQPELQLLMLGEDDKLLYCDAYDENDHSTVQVSNNLLRKNANCKFERVVDLHIFVLSRRACNVVKQLKHEDLGSFKQDFVPFLAKNQNNRQLIRYTDLADEIEAATSETPLVLSAWIDRESTTFGKRVLDLADYEAVNMLSLVRGPKEVAVLLPSIHTDPLVEKHDFESTSLALSAQLRENVKVRRSCIAANAKLGRNVEIVNCVVLRDATIDDDCKLYNCIVGSRAHIHRNSRLKLCQLGSESHVMEDSNLNGEIIIKAE